MDKFIDRLLVIIVVVVALVITYCVFKIVGQPVTSSHPQRFEFWDYSHK